MRLIRKGPTAAHKKGPDCAEWPPGLMADRRTTLRQSSPPLLLIAHTQAHTSTPTHTAHTSEQCSQRRHVIGRRDRQPLCAQLLCSRRRCRLPVPPLTDPSVAAVSTRWRDCSRSPLSPHSLPHFTHCGMTLVTSTCRRHQSSPPASPHLRHRHHRPAVHLTVRIIAANLFDSISPSPHPSHSVPPTLSLLASTPRHLPT